MCSHGRPLSFCAICVILLEDEWKAKQKPILDENDRLIGAMTEALGLVESALGCSLADVIGEELHKEIYGEE